MPGGAKARPKLPLVKPPRHRVNQNKNAISKLHIARHTYIQIGRVDLSGKCIDLVPRAKAGRWSSRAIAQLVPVRLIDNAIQHDLGGGDGIEGAVEKKRDNKAGDKAMNAQKFPRGGSFFEI